MTAPCPPLEPLASPATMGDLLRYSIDAVDAYHECAARHRALSELVSR